MHEWDWVIETCVNLKDPGLDNNLSWENHKKVSPYHCGSKRCDLCLSENVSIICADPDTLLKKGLSWFPSVATEINFCRPKLRNNCHGMFFNYLSQFLYKDTKQNWHVLYCRFFLLRTCGRPLLTISAIN